MSLIRSYLEQVHGWECMTRPLGEDGDDLRIVRFPGLSLELKNHETLKLGEWMRQAEEQAGDDKVPVVIHKRARKTDPADQWVTMTVATFVDLLKGP